MKPTYIFPIVMIVMVQESGLLDCCGGSERLCNILKGEWKS